MSADRLDLSHRLPDSLAVQLLDQNQEKKMIMITRIMIMLEVPNMMVLNLNKSLGTRNRLNYREIDQTFS